MQLPAAERLAAGLVRTLVPYCERCRVAGSIRRRKAAVKDIEIVAIPRWEEESDPASLFAEPVAVNRLFQWAQATSLVSWIKPGVSEIVPWTIRPDGKYWRGLLSDAIKLDLFIATHANWGIIYAIRTGSAEFTTALVTHAKQVGLPCVDGHLTRDGRPLETREETDVFRLLGLQYVEPWLRTGAHAVRRLRVQ